MSRPPRLPGEAARRVVGALRNLSGNRKELWKEMLFLDQGPEGCFASTREMAFRTGLTEGTVKKYRQTFQKLGMLEGEQRRDGRRWKWCWYPTLPCGIVPPAHRLTDEELTTHRDRLEAHIEAVKGNPCSPRKERATSDRGGTPVPLQGVVEDVLRGNHRSTSSRTSRGTAGCVEGERAFAMRGNPRTPSLYSEPEGA